MSEDEARRLSRYGKELQHMDTQTDQVDPIDNTIVGNEKQEGSDALRRPFSDETDEERHKRRQDEIAAWKPPSTQPAPQPNPRLIGWPFGTILWWTGKEKGVFNKKWIWKVGITNTHFFITNFDENGENPDTDAVRLEDCDAVVVSSHRESSYGMSMGMGMGIRTYMPRSSSTIGTIRFFETDGKVLFNLTADDPHGVVRIFKAARKITLDGIKLSAREEQKRLPKPSKPVSPAHIGTELSKLAQLLEKQELTKDEYEQAKKRLLEQ